MDHDQEGYEDQEDQDEESYKDQEDQDEEGWAPGHCIPDQGDDGDHGRPLLHQQGVVLGGPGAALPHGPHYGGVPGGGVHPGEGRLRPRVARPGGALEKH